MFMKHSSFKKVLLTGSLMSTSILATSLAIEAPADDAPPPPAAKGEAGDKLPVIELKPNEAPAIQQNAPFLGVVSAAVPQMLAEHLDLKSGEGVIIRSLVPNGPAANAGMAVNDVIIRVEGDAVGSPQELSEKIAAHPVGHVITLDLIHRGKPTTVKVTLGTRPAGVAGFDPLPQGPLNLDGIPQDLADRIREAIEGNLGKLDLLGENGPQMPPNMEEALRGLKQRMEGAMGQGFLAPEGAAAGNVQGEATVRLKDHDGSIEVKSKDGGKEVTVRDREDNIRWSGPWDTDQDKAAAPADVRSRVESLNLDPNFKGGGLRFQMNPAPPAQEN